jgi:hypothetical protein
VDVVGSDPERQAELGRPHILRADTCPTGTLWVITRTDN